MLARHFLIGVMALATLPNPSRPQVSEPPGRVLLTAAPLSDEITGLTVTAYSGAGRPAYIEVSLMGRDINNGRTNRGQRPPPFGATQAWLLRKDGTTVPKFDLGWWDIPFATRFAFQPVPASELAGVVVSAKGKLYVREIQVTSTP
jgi:hypothetical protein